MAYLSCRLTVQLDSLKYITKLISTSTLRCVRFSSVRAAWHARIARG